MTDICKIIDNYNIIILTNNKNNIDSKVNKLLNLPKGIYEITKEDTIKSITNTQFRPVVILYVKGEYIIYNLIDKELQINATVYNNVSIHDIDMLIINKNFKCITITDKRKYIREILNNYTLHKKQTAYNEAFLLFLLRMKMSDSELSKLMQEDEIKDVIQEYLQKEVMSS